MQPLNMGYPMPLEEELEQEEQLVDATQLAAPKRISTPVTNALRKAEAIPSVEELNVVAEQSQPMVNELAPTMFNDEILLAQEAKDKANRQQLFSRLGEHLMQGGAALGGTTYDPNFTAGDFLSKLGERDLDKVKERQDYIKNQTNQEMINMQLNDQRSLSDPNSAISQQYREMASKMLGGKQIDPKLSASQLAKTLPMLQQVFSAQNKENMTPAQMMRYELMQARNDIMKDRLGLSRDSFDFRVTEKQEDDAQKAVKDLRQTEPYKAARKVLSITTELEVLLEDAYKKGGQSLAMLGPKIAKGIAGEVGVLTEKDVTRYVQNPALIQGALDTYAKLTSGKITDVSYENLKRLIDLVKEANLGKLNDAVNREAVLFSRREGIPFEQARYMIDPLYDKPKTMRSEGYVPSLNELNTNEVKRKAKDGRIAIFDGKTKKFLRYEE